MRPRAGQPTPARGRENNLKSVCDRDHQDGGRDGRVAWRARFGLQDHATAIRAKANPLRPRAGLEGRHGSGGTCRGSGLAKEGARDGAVTVWAILGLCDFYD